MIMCIYKLSRYPCGHCYECLSKVRNDWSIRLQEQLKDTPIAYHAILTYSDDYLPKSKTGIASVCKKDVQDFLKRLRHNITNIKYFCVSEYGETTQRPHYHIIIFNVPKFDDLYRDNLHNSLHSEKLRSLIEKSWQKGQVRYRSSYVENLAQLHYILKDIYNWLEPIDLHKVEQKLKVLKRKKLYDNFIANTYKPFFKNGFKDDRVPNFRLMSKNLGIGFVDRVPKIPNSTQLLLDYYVLPKQVDNVKLQCPKDFVPCEDFYIHKNLYDSFIYDDQNLFLLPLEFFRQNSEHSSAIEYHCNISKKVNKNGHLVKVDDWHEFPMPRYYREKLFTYGTRAILALSHYSRLYKSQKEYLDQYLEYDASHDVPMSVLKAQIKYDQYKKSHKDKKSQRLQNNQSDNQ